MVPVNVLQPYQHWYAYKISITNKTDEGLRFEFELVDGALSLTMSPPRGIMAQMINDFLHFKFDMGGASAIASKSPIIGLLATSNFAHEDGNVWNICEYASNKKGGANFVASINGPSVLHSPFQPAVARAKRCSSTSSYYWDAFATKGWAPNS